MISAPKQTEETKEKNTLQDLLWKREELPRKLFLFALENLAVFGIPAGIAIYVGIRTGNVIASLTVALIFSWSFFFLRFWTILREARRIEKEIDEERKHVKGAKPEDFQNN